MLLPKKDSRKIKSQIVIDNGLIKTFEILEQNDSYFQKLLILIMLIKLLMNKNNLKKLIQLPVLLEVLQLLKMAINTLADYKENHYAE